MCAKLPRTPNNLSLYMVVIMQNTQENANLQKTKVNTTKTRKVHVDRNKLHAYWERIEDIYTQKFRWYRSNVVVWQADRHAGMH